MSRDLEPGTLFATRYRILRRIAAGGMGAVYEVLHIETERRRALKVMLPHVLQSDDLRERFKREARVAGQVDCELIVEVFDAGVDQATEMPFLVMELLRGEELGKRLKRLGALPPTEVVEFLRQTALALDKTHRASIIHRDLKPENLFLTEREDGPPRIKVLDFGIAKVIAESTTGGGTQSIGTPLYMAPEQFQAETALTGAVDIYALGMVAFTLLVGSPYWGDEAKSGNVFAIATAAVMGVREPASARAARRGVTLPPGFDPWFSCITARRPEARFATAGEAVRALGEALGVAVGGWQSLPAIGAVVSGSGPVAAPALTPQMPLPGGPTLPLSPASQAQATGPGMSVTAPATSRGPHWGVLLAAAAALGTMIGLAVFIGTRGAPSAISVGAPSAAAAAASTSVVAPPEAPASAAVQVEPGPAASAATPASAEAPQPSATASAAPPAKPPVKQRAPAKRDRWSAD